MTWPVSFAGRVGYAWCVCVGFVSVVGSTVVRLVVSVASSVVFIPWRKCWGDSSSGMRWPGVFLRVFFLLLFPLDCLASDPRGTDFGHRLRCHRGNPVHGVHAETAQRITEAPAFHAEGVKGGSSYGKTKADFKSEE